jgi:hypothetical protein
VVAALAAGGFFLFIPSSHPDDKLVGRLLIAHSAAPGVPSKASTSEAVPAATSTFKVVKKAEKADPQQTALYERAWYVTASAPPETGLLLELLPDAPSASLALTDSNQQLKKTPQFTGETASKRTRFLVGSVPGARGVSFTLTDDTTKKLAGHSYSVDFRVGRVVISELMVTTRTTPSTSAAIRDVQAEYSVLRRVEPGFSLSPSHLPTVASVVYIVVGALAVAGAFFLPEWALAVRDRRREHREAKERERIRSEYRARGRRAVRRHRAPDWRQGRQGRQGARR